MAFFDFLAPPAHKPLMPQERIAAEYKVMRLKVFLGIYFGYAAYYLVRKNLSFAVPDMIKEGLIDKAGAGVAMAGIPIAYAISKFIMGSVSDRSDARKFMSIGLVLASIVMLAVGLIPFSAGYFSTTVTILFVFMLLAGWLSGMGWPPCGRILAHWFSQNERSFKMSIWNTAHNIGNGTLALLVSAGVFIFSAVGIDESWRAAFIVPALVALLFAGLCWWTLRDTPESCGLPAIEDYRKDYTGAKASKGEEEKIPFRRLFIDYVFKNKMLWLIAAANVFVYFVRYGISDWSPTYLQQVYEMSKEESSLAFALFEYAGIPGTILCGWLSSRFFQGRCAPVNVIFMLMVALGIVMYWDAASIAAITGISLKYIVYTALSIIGGAVYGPIAMIGIQALALVPKNAAGTAAGFMGLFGYMFGDAVLSKIAMGYVASSELGWNFTFQMFLFTSLLAAGICMVAWGKEKRIMEERVRQAETLHKL